MPFDYDRDAENRMNRRLRDEPRQLARLDRQLDAADALIGELKRDGVKVCYINQLSRTGRPTGKTIERPWHKRYELVDYLIRNRYV